MPPRTRARGPPEGGFTHLSQTTRERKPVSSPLLKLRKQQTQTSPKQTLKMVTPPTVVPALTKNKETQTPRKRPLEDNDDEELERALKRPNTEPRPPRPQYGSTPLFGDRNRSALTPSRFVRNRPHPRKPLPRFNPLEAEAQRVRESLPKPVEAAPAPEASITESPTSTPKKEWFVGRVFGSLKKKIFGSGGEETPTPQEPATPTPAAPPAPALHENPFEAAPINPRRAAQTTRLARITSQQKQAETAKRSDMQATVEDAMDSPAQEEHDLQTTEVSGSRKRKLDTATDDRQPKKLMLNADENGKPTGSYGLTDEDLEYSDDDNEEEERPSQTPPSTAKITQSQNMTQKNDVSQPFQSEQSAILKTPGTLGLDNFEPSFSTRGKALRSAMKANPNNTSKKVAFSSQLEHYRVFGNMGPAGEYRGDLFHRKDPKTPEEHDFANTSPMSLDTPSTTTPAHIDKQRTYNNTHSNFRANRLDAANNATGAWAKTQEKTPVITNKSGHFEVPFVDDDSSEQGSPASGEPEEQTPVPSAPKISHASLPDTDERLDKARQEAQRYAPNRRSRLSNVEPVERSRSTSPAPMTAATADLDDAEEMRKAQQWAANIEWPEPTTYENADEETKEKMREAEEWAKSIKWPEPQTYVEAGLVSPYIDQLLRERWTKEDDRLTHQFWSKEFTDVDRMMNAAKAAGKTLELVYEED